MTQEEPLARPSGQVASRVQNEGSSSASHSDKPSVWRLRGTPLNVVAPPAAGRRDGDIGGRAFLFRAPLATEPDVAWAIDKRCAHVARRQSGGAPAGIDPARSPRRWQRSRCRFEPTGRRPHSIGHRWSARESSRPNRRRPSCLGVPGQWCSRTDVDRGAVAMSHGDGVPKTARGDGQRGLRVGEIYGNQADLHDLLFNEGPAAPVGEALERCGLGRVTEMTWSLAWSRRS